MKTAREIWEMQLRKDTVAWYNAEKLIEKITNYAYAHNDAREYHISQNKVSAEVIEILKLHGFSVKSFSYEASRSYDGIEVEYEHIISWNK